MDECIRQKILEDIIRRERAVIMDSILTEFDEKAYEDMIREEGFAGNHTKRNGSYEAEGMAQRIGEGGKRRAISAKSRNLARYT